MAVRKPPLQARSLVRSTMRSTAQILTAGGTIVLPAHTPYDHELLVEHLAD